MRKYEEFTLIITKKYLVNKNVKKSFSSFPYVQGLLTYQKVISLDEK